MNKILWVTSFNKELYEASGRHLLRSFEATESEGDFYIGYENMTDIDPGKAGTTWFDLDYSDMLQKFLKTYEDAIPEYLGGKAKPCNCSTNPFKKEERFHIKGCHFTWWNRNASRWFRKFATLEKALNWADESTFICWLDSDCLFKNKVTVDFITKLFGENELLYLRGVRGLLEAGFVGYNNDDILQILFQLYMSGNFRHLKRWDDCYALEKVIGSKRFICKDIATKTHGDFGDVFTHSEIGNYLVHNKGLHGRKLGLMK